MSNDKYSKVRNDSIIFKKKCEYAEHGIEFKCPSCGLEKFLLGREAKFYNGQRIPCKSCGQFRIEYKGKMGQKRAVHLNNIKSRKTDITTNTQNLIHE